MVSRKVLTKAWELSGKNKTYSLDWLADYCDKEKILIVAIDGPEYPRLLKEIPDPPEVLYIKGPASFNSRLMIAVVGTRQISHYGEMATQQFTLGLVQSGFTIVSGFMYGVDAMAHKTAMEAGGSTIGVLGFGFESMYPASHKALMQRMLAAGQTLVTEYPPWQPPLPRNFPARNRIVSGMSLGVLVIEAAAKSGSKITARLAAEQGREVFAVPGPFNSSFSEGTKELVNLGAKLVTSVDDILEEISP